VGYTSQLSLASMATQLTHELSNAICDVQKEHEQAAFKWQKKEFKSPCNMAK